MRLIGKLIIIIILLGVLLSASAYIVLYTDTNGGSDTQPPQITFTSGNFTVIAGQTTAVTVIFTDNVKVTEATLHYTVEESTIWNTLSLLNGTASISIPAATTTDYFYYITVDDAAGNGPIGEPSIDGSVVFTITVKQNNGEEDFTHFVFVEESTSVTCRYCPNVGAILEKLESSHAYRFYYVSMILENSVAADYLSSHYNRYGDPTVYIDGGYKVLLGGTQPEMNYTSAIQAAENRMVPKITVRVNAEYKNTTNTIETSVAVFNGEQSDYTGALRVYLAEIIPSQFNDYNGLKYRNGFVDFIFNEEISVSAKSNKIFTDSRSVGSLDYENLKIIAVVFNSTKNVAYSNPLANENQFDAYYADAANETYVAKGARNLPPEVGILSPQQGKIYLRGNLRLSFLYKNKLLKNTWMIGKASIDTYAKDDSSISRVEIYVNDKLVANMTEPPYNWTLTSKLIKKPLIPKNYTITVKAYDDTNKMGTATIDVKAWWAF
ncbi:MAG TPA: glutaredoxin [Thermoplasmata archaeon]|nr:glutaredoxin [Thermoplasmata archaeon]